MLLSLDTRTKHPKRTPLKTASQGLKDKGVKIYPVGIKPNVNPQDLQDATSKPSNVYVIPFKQLAGTANRIADTVKGFSKEPSYTKGEKQSYSRIYFIKKESPCTNPRSIFLKTDRPRLANNVFNFGWYFFFRKFNLSLCFQNTDVLKRALCPDCSVDRGKITPAPRTNQIPGFGSFCSLVCCYGYSRKNQRYCMIFTVALHHCKDRIFDSSTDLLYAADVGFLIASSPETTPVKWSSILDNVNSMVDAFPVSSEGTHLAVSTVGEVPKVALRFNTLSAANYNPNEIKRRISQIPYEKVDRTRIDLGLEKVAEDMFTEQSGMRKEAPKVQLESLKIICYFLLCPWCR